MANASHQFMHHDGTVVIAFPKNLRNTTCRHFQAECQRLEEDMRRGVVRNVVIDCSETNCFGCSALGLFVRLWKTAETHGGQFAMCCLSDLHQEMLTVMRLDNLWPVYATRHDALAAINTAPSRLLLQSID